jgi:hypothetical protein
VSPAVNQLRATRAGALLLSIILAGCFLRYGLVNPGRNYQLDFRAFYATGRALHAGLNPYDLDAKRAAIGPQLPGRQHLMGYANPPPTLPLLYLVAMLPLAGAQIAWAWFQFGCLLVGMGLLFRAVEAEFGSPASLLIAIPFWLSYPVYNLFRWGQFDGLRVVLLALAVFLIARRRLAPAGMSIGLAAVAKVYPAAYLWVFLLRREWKALSAGLVTLGVLMTASLAALSPAARDRYLFVNGDEFSKVDWVISPENMSVVGFVHRAFVDNEVGAEPSRAWLNLGPRFALAASVAGGLGLVAITTLWTMRRRRELTAAETIAAFVPVILLAELNAWPHHCVVMLVPLALIVAIAVRQPRLEMGDMVWIGAILFLYTFCPVHQFDIGLSRPLAHLVGPTTTYAMVLAWLFMLLRYPLLKRRLATVVP